jgi:hypothetical protein
VRLNSLKAKTCAICDRSLLVGEEPVRFSPDGSDQFVDVCPLCQESALDHGWVREGSPLVPSMRPMRRRRGLSLGAIFGGAPKRPAAESIVAEPILRRLSGAEQTIVEAAAIFNQSDFVRTVEGISRSLGEPQVSIVPLSGVNTEVVVTFAWDISWYQYRLTIEGAQPVRLEERGLDPAELDPKFVAWNARLEQGGVVPEIAPL